MSRQSHGAPVDPAASRFQVGAGRCQLDPQLPISRSGGIHTRSGRELQPVVIPGDGEGPVGSGLARAEPSTRSTSLASWLPPDNEGRVDGAANARNSDREEERKAADERDRPVMLGLFDSREKSILLALAHCLPRFEGRKFRRRYKHLSPASTANRGVIIGDCAPAGLHLPHQLLPPSDVGDNSAACSLAGELTAVCTNLA